MIQRDLRLAKVKKDMYVKISDDIYKVKGKYLQLEVSEGVLQA